MNFPTNSNDSNPPMISVVPSTEPDSGTDEPIPSDKTFEDTAKASAEWGMQHEVQIKALEVRISQFTISFYLLWVIFGAHCDVLHAHLYIYATYTSWSNLQAKLANDLSNSRAIHNLIVEALVNLEVRTICYLPLTPVSSGLPPSFYKFFLEKLTTIKHAQSNTQRVDRALTRHIPHIHSELQSSLSHLLALESRFPVLRTQVNAVRSAYDKGRETARALQSDLEWTHAPLAARLHRTLFTRRAPVSALETALTRLVFLLVVLLCAWQVGSVLEGAYRAYRHRLVWGDKLIS